MNDHQAAKFLELADWRRKTAEMYAAVRTSGDPEIAWNQFRITRDQLFKQHPQSPLQEDVRRTFSALDYHEYQAAFRVIGRIETAQAPSVFTIELPVDGLLRLHRFAFAVFELFGQPARLALYWVEGYGGGLFLPFKDLTNGISTFGGGRYLYDTIKGADLATRGREIILDFNFAYNPSCAYSPRWVCPLASEENRLALSIPAGEKWKSNPG